jgi:nicotinamide mononucleotide adenylyltransferase
MLHFLMTLKAMVNDSVGVIHGRFQPPHLGHMEYLLAGKNNCKFLCVGIANPDPGLTASDPTNPARSLPMANPFTYYERLVMLRDALLAEGVPREEFEIVPFPINYPDRLRYYVPLNAQFFVTIYDDWGRQKVQLLESLGVEVNVMWERNIDTRITSGTQIRRLIAANQVWEHLVPDAVAQIIKKSNLDRRIQEIARLENAL